MPVGKEGNVKWVDVSTYIASSLADSVRHHLLTCRAFIGPEGSRLVAGRLDTHCASL